MDIGTKQEILVSLAAALSLGTCITVAARKLRFPTVILLLAAGVALGPEGLHLIKLASFEALLPAIVSLAIAIILFEGGLTLDLAGCKDDMVVIRRLLTLGVLVTWGGAAACIRIVLGIDFSFALMAGSKRSRTGCGRRTTRSCRTWARASRCRTSWMPPCGGGSASRRVSRGGSLSPTRPSRSGSSSSYSARRATPRGISQPWRRSPASASRSSTAKPCSRRPAPRR